MASELTLRIVTPDRVVLDQKVEQVSAWAIDGEFTVLANHIPLVTALAYDVLTYKSAGQDSIIAVLGGILEVNDNTVTVLSDAAELATEIDEARARQAKERAEAEKTQRTDKLDVYVSELAFSRAIARLKAAELSRRRGSRRHDSGM